MGCDRVGGDERGRVEHEADRANVGAANRALARNVHRPRHWLRCAVGTDGAGLAVARRRWTTDAILFLWMATVVSLVAVAWTGSSRPALRRAVVIATFALLSVIAWRVAHRMDASWVDACQFGTSEHSRCMDGETSAPT